MKKHGTTIVEVMIIITIFAILATVVITYYVNHTKKSRDAKKISDLLLVQTQIQNYQKEYQHYPIVNDTPKNISTLVPKYFNNFPNIAGAVYVSDGNFGSTYALCVELEVPANPALPVWKLDLSNPGGYPAPQGICALP